MSPGPDFAVVTRHSALGGRGPGLAAAAGVASAMAVNTIAAIAGIGAIVAASPKLYTAVRLVGAAHLLYLGIRALLAIRSESGGLGGDEDAGNERVFGWTAFRRGFLTNFLNPKVVVFLVTLMPQFLPEDPTMAERVILGTVSVVMVLAWSGAVALLVSLFRWVFQKPTARKIVNGVTGAALVVVGLSFALNV
ncbi:LysE family translocator [Micromonospora sp. Llam7]|uniref:LysE family translocator n=1 Tax=Micromonospora tarapacensis TaxID=2835305 RepID=UPI001C8362E6|nr:LysE family translocator [Micromonospora tarapacensis]MBX7268182.1 LysE family translocator [Micromonospora tarapacensis]